MAAPHAAPHSLRNPDAETGSGAYNEDGQEDLNAEFLFLAEPPVGCTCSAPSYGSSQIDFRLDLSIPAGPHCAFFLECIWCISFGRGLCGAGPFFQILIVAFDVGF